MSEQRPGTALQRLPLPVLFIAVAVIWAGMQLVFAHGVIDAFRIGLDVIGGLVVAAVTTLGIGLRRRRLGGTDASLSYASAIRSGVLPDGVDTAGWSEEITRSERRLRINRWIVRVGGLLPFGLGVWGATEADSRVLGIVLAVLMVAGWIWTEIATPRMLARMERLRSSLPG